MRYDMRGNGRGFRILVVEDSTTQAELLRQVLGDEGYSVRVAGDGEKGLVKARELTPDLIISDIAMPVMDGYELCRVIKGDEELARVPVMLLSSLSESDNILEGLSVGADDYITKPYDAEHLLSKVRVTLESPSATGNVKTDALELSIAGKRHVITAGRRQILNLLLSIYENSVRQNRLLKDTEQELKVFNENLEQEVKDRTEALRNEITERKKIEEALRDGERRYRRLLDAVTDYIYTVEVRDGKAVSTTHCEGCVAVTGYSSEECSSDPFLWHRMIYAEDSDRVMEHAEKVVSGMIPPPIEHRMIRKDGRVIWVKNTAVPHFDEKGVLVSYDGLISDITDRRNIEEQLYQSQKLEAMGRLAGGVAHDFNNCLNGIMGFTELSMMQLKPGDLLYKNLETIYGSAEKAAGITRQLLAFSRKQVVEPKALNINDIVGDLGKMLRRLIGEDIELISRPADDLGSINADVTQVEQILINLAVNARDAMPEGGELIIETSNVTVDEAYTEKHFGIAPSDYVMLSVSDTGTGMSEQVKLHIFEPFFTTKEEGKGTGLGLSTVYGIVQQNGGHIFVYSEEREGTTFKIYFPKSASKAEKIPPKRVLSDQVLRGDETILVVEDDGKIRQSVTDIFRIYGYNVINAIHGAEALAVFERGESEIDLVLTDIVMPHMGGPELVRRLKRMGVGAKVLYMSGYTDDTTLNNWTLDPGMNFISKPFSLFDMLKKVREVLGERRSLVTGQVSGGPMQVL